VGASRTLAMVFLVVPTTSIDLCFLSSGCVAHLPDIALGPLVAARTVGYKRGPFFLPAGRQRHLLSAEFSG